MFFTNSGAEANEAALKLTRRTGRTHLVAAEGSFHGRTMGALALTSKAAYREPFEPLPGHVTFVPYGDPDALADAVTDQTAAVVLEPMQGEAGVVEPPPGYLAGARRITQEHRALLWLDEVQTGIGRTGSWLCASADPEVAPDVVTLAKGLGGGLPIGVCVGLGQPGTCSSPATTARRSAATRSPVRPPSPCSTRSSTRTARSRDTLGPPAAHGRRRAIPGDRRPRARTSSSASRSQPTLRAWSRPPRSHGFIVNATGQHTVRLAPPLVLGDDEAEAFLAAWPGILADAADAADAAERGSPRMTRHFLRDDNLSHAEQHEVLSLAASLKQAPYDSHSLAGPARSRRSTTSPRCAHRRRSRRGSRNSGATR